MVPPATAVVRGTTGNALYRELVPQENRRQINAAISQDTSRIWTTYGIADWEGSVRYVGCSCYPLLQRLYGHVACARSACRSRRQPSRWHRWLVDEIAARRPIYIFEIGVDPEQYLALAREAAAMDHFVDGGVDLLNTRPATVRP